MVKTHKDLDVWKEAVEFVKEVYEITAQFPKEEIYGLTLICPTIPNKYIIFS